MHWRHAYVHASTARAIPPDVAHYRNSNRFRSVAPIRLVRGSLQGQALRYYGIPFIVPKVRLHCKSNGARCIGSCMLCVVCTAARALGAC